MMSEWLRDGMLLACLAALVVACGATSPTLQPLATGNKAAATAVSSGTPQMREGALLREIQADLDGNGSCELVTATQTSNGVVISIVHTEEGASIWQALLPSGAEFGDLWGRDLTADSVAEVLVEYRIPQEHIVGLGIIRWAGDEGLFLTPQGGPLAGVAFFQSRYYAPWIEDLNGDNCPEIIISLDGSNPNYLDSAIYEWGKSGYAATDFFIVPPRLRPTPST